MGCLWNHTLKLLSLIAILLLTFSWTGSLIAQKASEKDQKASEKDQKVNVMLYLDAERNQRARESDWEQEVNERVRNVSERDLAAAITLIVIKADKNGDFQIERVARGSDKILIEMLARMKKDGCKNRVGYRMLFVDMQPSGTKERPVPFFELLEIYQEKFVLIKEKIVDWEKAAKLP